LAQRLGAETVLTGEILHMIEVDSGSEVDTELTLVLKHYAGDSGKLLWSTYHKRRGEEYSNVLHYADSEQPVRSGTKNGSGNIKFMDRKRDETCTQ